MVLIDKLQTARSIDYTRQSFKTPFASIFVGIWPHQLAQSTPRQGRITPLGSEVSDSDQIAALPVGDVLNLDVVIDTAALTVEFLEVVLSLPVTMQCPCSHCSFTKSGWVSVPNTVLVVGVLCQLQSGFLQCFCKRNLWSLNGMGISMAQSQLGEFCSTLGTLWNPSRLRLLAQLRKHFALESREICSSWRSPNLRLILASRCHILSVSLNNFLLWDRNLLRPETRNP